MRQLILFLSLLLNSVSFSQSVPYTIANAHSHNDYEQPVPFYTAYYEGFGSVEADIFLHNGELLVAHEIRQLQPQHTLETLYLQPLLKCVQQHNGYVFADSTRQLQLLIDVKTEAVATLAKLVETLEKYPALTRNPSLKFVISGNRPAEAVWNTYPSWIWFDGRINTTYSPEALSRIALLSDDLKRYAKWNGKGNIPQPEYERLQKTIAAAHALQKPVRFWGSPDFINAWYQLMHLGIDYINTDSIAGLSAFLRQLPGSSHTVPGHYTPYRPAYKNDGVNRRVKNILLFIGDGTGLAQLYAGYTANHGALNIFGMRNIGLSKTSSYDNYVTDSAPGSTSIASGKKTRNRYVGVDHTGVALPLLPALLRSKKMKTGLVTCGDITDATPADFYAHRTDRDSTQGILTDLKHAGIDLLMGAGPENQVSVQLLAGLHQGQWNAGSLAPEYTMVSSIDSIPQNNNSKYVVIDKKAGLSMQQGRGNWLGDAFTKAVQLLSNNRTGFFLMTEGAQIDYGGHANQMSYVVAEVLDFDQVIGQALAFADASSETLVIVTGDHETGGLTLLDGDYKKGYVSGRFTTNDHTALPVPVFAYGARSYLFRGVYENTELFDKILEAIK